MTKLKLTGNSKLLKKTKSGINQKELSLALSNATKCGTGINTQRGFISLPNFNSETGGKDSYSGLYVKDGELVVDTITNVKNATNPNCGNGGGGGTQALRLTFDSIENANLIVGDASNVSDWNTFFDLPTYGNSFTSVNVIGSGIIELFGGSNIEVKIELFKEVQSLIEVDDQAGSIVALGEYCFGLCENLLSVNLPNLITAGFESFGSCYYITTINLPQVIDVSNSCFSYCYFQLTTVNLSSVQNLGSTTGDDFIFENIAGNNITLTVPAALMTADSGSPDGDIAYLQANNTVTVITV